MEFHSRQDTKPLAGAGTNSAQRASDLSIATGCDTKAEAPNFRGYFVKAAVLLDHTLSEMASYQTSRHEY